MVEQAWGLTNKTHFFSQNSTLFINIVSFHGDTPSSTFLQHIYSIFVERFVKACKIALSFGDVLHIRDESLSLHWGVHCVQPHLCSFGLVWTLHTNTWCLISMGQSPYNAFQAIWFVFLISELRPREIEFWYFFLLDQ